MKQGYQSFNPNHIISITECPQGVRDMISGELVTKERSSIIETLSTTYVVENLIEISNLDIHVNLCDIVVDRRCKKSDYRPHHMREGGRILINQDYIISKTISLTGIIDCSTNQIFSSTPATIIETLSKCYVVANVVHHDATNKFLSIPLTAIFASKSSKKAEYQSNDE